MSRKIDRVWNKSFSTARNWTSFQFVALKGSLITLAMATAKVEVDAQQQGEFANLSRYLLVAFLMFLLAITSYLEKWFNQQEDRRRETEDLMQKVGELQSAAISYLFDSVLPQANHEQVLDIIERFPVILGMMSMSTVRRQIGEGYKVVVDAVANINSTLSGIKEEIIREVEQKTKPISEIIDAVLSNKPPKPELFPKDME